MLRNRYGETTDTAVYHLYPHFDFGGPGVDGSGHDGGTLPTWESVYNDHEDAYGDRIYAHIFEENDKTVIQYWFFYPYNDWWNNHEGDWEHINVIVSSLDPQQAVAEAVEYYFHHDYISRVVVEPGASGTSDNPLIGLQGLEGVDNSVALIKGRRPVVYVGGWGEALGGSGPGGHGSYPCHGPWYLAKDFEIVVVIRWEVAGYDNADGKGSILYDVPLTVLANASEYDYDVNPEMSWLKADLRFGHRYVDSPPLTRGDGNAAPEGPSYKETWRRTGEMAGIDENTFFSTTRLNFQHHFIKENTSWSGDVLLIGDIIIYPGATLDIAPGTTITSDVGQDLHGMNDAARVDIVNHGTMTADASEGDSIVFRSNASVPSPGDWYGIRNYGKLTMKNCVIRDSRGSVEGYGTQTLENVRFVNNDTLSVPLISNIVASQNVAIEPIQVDASGGRRPYTYSLSGTSDLSISESGLITGIPTQTGTFTDTVTVTTAADETDLTSDSVVRSFTMTVYPQLIVKLILISNSDTTAIGPFIDATLNVDITPIQVYASGGKPPYQYSLRGDDVSDNPIDPSGGLSISNTGSITGAPRQTGTPDFTVTVTDENDTEALTSFVLDVSATPLPKPALPQLSVLPISDVDDATQDEAITPIQASAQGGEPSSYTYSLSGSPNDNGIEISEGGGLITGTPTQTGTYSFKVKVTDGDSRADSTSFDMRVSPPLTISEISDVEDATQGVAITPIQASAQGGRSPYTYSLSGSPDDNGIEISEHGGLITGTPAQTGTYSYKVKVTDRDSRADSTSFTMRVSPPLVISPRTISDVEATKGEAIAAIQMSASGGRGTYVYSLPGAPSNISISSSGRISGRPTQTGSFTNVRATVTDVDGRTASTLPFTIRVSPPLVISPQTITQVEATKGEAIAAIQMSASGGRGTYVYSLPGAPSNISISSSGRISGRPTQTGSFTNVRATVTDVDGRTASTLPFTIRVSPPLVISPQTITQVEATKGEAIAAIQMSASGGRGTYVYSLPGAPSNISISSGGRISGRPTQTGSFTNVRATVTDADGRTASTLPFTIRVSPPLEISPQTITQVEATKGEAIAAIQMSASGGRGTYVYSLPGAPSNISISSGGRISGRPTQTGSFTNVRATVTDADGRTASTLPFTIRVSPPLEISPQTITQVEATKGEAIAAIQMSASGGRGTYVYSLPGAPSSISISSSGRISGRPTQTGSFTNVRAKVTDADGRTASTLPFTIRVSPPLRPPSISDVDDATQNVAIRPIPLNASGGRGAYAYSLSGSPSKNGIAVSGNSIRGTPGQTGSYTYTVTVRDVDNRTASTSFDMLVSPPLTVAEISDVEATRNVAITPIHVNASGGRGSYTYSPLSGAPSEIEVSSSGFITGTPTQVGTSRITVTVTDADDRTASTSFDVRVSPPLEISPQTISDVEATKGVAIADIQVSASGGRTPYAYSLTGAPSGISISSSGLIRGTPTQTGSFTVTAKVRDADNRTASTLPFTIRVSAPLTVSRISDVEDATRNVAITSIQVAAQGGRRPYWYSLSGEPSGISMSGSGLITGTPTETGIFPLSATVTDRDGRTASAPFLVDVAAPLTVSSIGNVSATQNRSITSIQVSASGGEPSYRYSLSGAPGGISVSNSGLITGAPTQSGSFTVKATVTDAGGRTASASFTMSVAAPLSVASISEIEAYTNVAMTSVQVSASGGKPSYGYSMSGAPSGISISSSGLIAGTPTERGWFDVTVTVTDRDGTTASTSFNIDVL